MNVMYKLFPLIFFSLLSLLLFLSGAKIDDTIPHPDPEGVWRIVTQDPSTTTSKCVGDASSILCAVDTFRACVDRMDNRLCRKVMIHPHEYDTLWNSYYRIEKTKLVTCDNLSETGRADEEIDLPKIGDVIVGYSKVSCHIGEDCSGKEASYNHLIMRKTKTGWKEASICDDCY